VFLTRLPVTGGDLPMLKLSGVLAVLGLALLLLSTLPWPTTAAEMSGTMAASSRGEALFRDKGCALCHLHRQVEGRTGDFAYGPDLSTYTGDSAFLRRWLADPRAVRPAAEMPALSLSVQEIDDLIAFLNTPR
jgi:cytochrome c oxidase subunit 2